MSKYKHILLVLFIVSLAIVLRLFDLGNMPFGLANDESNIIYNAYSIWHTGHDLRGKFLPFSINVGASYSPVYIYLTAPFVGLFGLSPFVGRLPFALLAIGSVVLTYLLAKQLSKNSFIAAASAFVLAVSPWHLQASRAALDHNFALFFYLLGIYLFIRFAGKKSIVWTIPVFFLAFYSYHATKVFFIFLIPLLLFYYRHVLLQSKKQTITFIVCCVFILLSFVYITKTQSVTRQEVFIWNNTADIAKTVNYERTYNSAPFVVREVFNNKLFTLARIFRENYLTVFSTTFLFLYGDQSAGKQMLSIPNHGAFYVLDALFLLFGMYYILRYEKNKILLPLILIAPIASGISNAQTYFSRSIMLIPFLAIVIGYGMYGVYTLLEKQKNYLKATLTLCLALWYCCLVVSLLYQYFYRYSLTGAEAWNASSRELSTYVYENKGNYKHITIDVGSNLDLRPIEPLLINYSIYNTVDPLIFQKIASPALGTTIGNVSFVHSCPSGNITESLPRLQKDTLLIVPDYCYYNNRPFTAISDKGEPMRIIWKMYKK